MAATSGEKEETRKKRVLILMSDTGGGHRASALALETALEELFPGKVRDGYLENCHHHEHY